tara:strand:- start:324 stop:1751 length:1428 start_codon:yes stop_codon:yes gene_type:complete
MRYREFKILEGSTKAFLSGNTLFAYLNDPKKNRIPVFRDKLEKGGIFTHENGKPCKVTEPQAVQKFDAWVKQYLEAPQGKKPSLTLQSDQGPLVFTQSSGPLMKTKEFHGQQPDYQGQGGGKVSYKTQPSDLGLEGKDFTKDQLFKAVLNSNLKDNEFGKKIIEFIKTIPTSSGALKIPDFSMYDGGIENFRDNAGEYIGILMMLNGKANWVSGAEEAFVNHIGSPIEQMKVNFPAGKTFGLADTVGVVATFKNETTGNSVMISTKGGKSGDGAPFSLTNVKVPKIVEQNTQNKVEIGFMKIVTEKTGKQTTHNPYRVTKYLGDNGSADCSAVGVNVSDEEITEFFKANPTAKNIDKFPKFKNILNNIRKIYVSSKAEQNLKQGYPVANILNYLLLMIVSKEINKNKVAMPNFEPFIRECLQQNFIKVGNSINKAGDWFTNVTWPNRELKTGGVTIQSKATMTQPPSSNISIKVK